MIHPKKGVRQIERILAAAPVAEEPAPDSFQIKEPLEPAELALLRQFFELLAEWDESQEGENGDE